MRRRKAWQLFMYQKPRAAKRLFFDVIPRAVDDYLSFAAPPRRRAAGKAPGKSRLAHPQRPGAGGRDTPLSFNVLLNLASVCNTEDAGVLWGFISRYAPGATRESLPVLASLVGYAIRYYQDFVKPHKRFRRPSQSERQALEDLLQEMEALPANADGEAIQTAVYEVGKRHDFANLRDWFKALYEILLGQEQGPRLGSFMALYGLEESKSLVRDALNEQAAG